jgi:hypothetical protein
MGGGRNRRKLSGRKLLWVVVRLAAEQTTKLHRVREAREHVTAIQSTALGFPTAIRNASGRDSCAKSVISAKSPCRQRSPGNVRYSVVV